MRSFIFCLAVIFTINSNAQLTFQGYDLNPSGASTPRNLTVCSGKLFFSATDGVHGIEPWVSDGTIAGTNMLLDINTGTAASNPSHFTEFNNKVYFSATNAATGTELWVTDGTPGGTSMLTEISPGTSNSSPSNFLVYKNTLLFIADSTNIYRRLYTIDATSGTWQLFSDKLVNIGAVTVYNNELYLSANDITGNKGTELWKSDLTINNTILVLDINTGTQSSNPGNFFQVNANMFFTARNSSGNELWITDGSTNGTVMVKDINPGSVNSDPHSMLIYNNKLYFLAIEAISGLGIWESDGTLLGTHLMPMPSGIYSTYLGAVYNGKLFFNAQGSVGNEPYSTDGTAASTLLLINIDKSPNSSAPSNYTVYRNKLYFAASAYGSDYEGYRSNGKDSGTLLIAPPGATNVGPLTFVGANAIFNGFTEYNGSLYFGANFDATGGELWSLTDTSSTTNITPVNLNNDFSISPNPGKGEYVITLPTGDFQNIEICVRDIKGQMISCRKANSSSKNVSLSLTDKPKGIYTVQVKNETFNKTKIVVLQ